MEHPWFPGEDFPNESHSQLLVMSILSCKNADLKTLATNGGGCLARSWASRMFLNVSSFQGALDFLDYVYKVFGFKARVLLPEMMGQARQAMGKAIYGFIHTRTIGLLAVVINVYPLQMAL